MDKKLKTFLTILALAHLIAPTALQPCFLNAYSNASGSSRYILVYNHTRILISGIGFINITRPFNYTVALDPYTVVIYTVYPTSSNIEPKIIYKGYKEENKTLFIYADLQAPRKYYTNVPVAFGINKGIYIYVEKHNSTHLKIDLVARDVRIDYLSSTVIADKGVRGSPILPKLAKPESLPTSRDSIWTSGIPVWFRKLNWSFIVNTKTSEAVYIAGEEKRLNVGVLPFFPLGYGLNPYNLAFLIANNTKKTLIEIARNKPLLEEITAKLKGESENITHRFLSESAIERKIVLENIAPKYTYHEFTCIEEITQYPGKGAVIEAKDISLDRKQNPEIREASPYTEEGTQLLVNHTYLVFSHINPLAKKEMSKKIREAIRSGQKTTINTILANPITTISSTVEEGSRTLFLSLEGPGIVSLRVMPLPPLPPVFNTTVYIFSLEGIVRPLSEEVKDSLESISPECVNATYNYTFNEVKLVVESSCEGGARVETYFWPYNMVNTNNGVFLLAKPPLSTILKKYIEAWREKGGLTAYRAFIGAYQAVSELIHSALVRGVNEISEKTALEAYNEYFSWLKNSLKSRLPSIMEVLSSNITTPTRTSTPATPTLPKTPTSPETKTVEKSNTPLLELSILSTIVAIIAVYAAYRAKKK